MITSSTDFKSDRLFPFHFQLLGIVFFLIGVVAIFDSPYLATFLIPIAALILTGYRGIQFDRSSKVYREYNSFLFFLKFGKVNNHDDIEKIYVNSSKVSQKIYTMVTQGITARNVEYNSYLKLADGTKIYLASNMDKKALFEKLAELADFFQLEVIDNTG